MIVKLASITNGPTRNIYGIRYKVKAENSLSTSVRSQLIQNGFLGKSREKKKILLKKKNSKICHENQSFENQ